MTKLTQEQIDGQLGDLDQQFHILLDALTDQNRREIGQKLRELNEARSKLWTDRTTARRERPPRQFTEQDYREIHLALDARFPDRAAFRLDDPIAAGRAMADRDWKIGQVTHVMDVDQCTVAEAINKIDQLKLWPRDK
ncbi:MULTISPECIES: hypothetical protein [unclassified Bradyrhizobium]|uniref:hypothetical protein n=1 Tax=unclassified Bradyrhizobium TaxID=2631580 RepID=UPI0028E4AA6C|nr:MULTISPECIES: hypothetical protein [unclassified Bradyrhizobium]